MTKHNIITGILLLIIGLLLAAHVRQDKQREQRLIQTRNDVEQQLERTEQQFKRSEEYRDSISAVCDSLNNSVVLLHTSLKQKDKEIASIKGRYDTVEADSLSKLMESRSASRSGTH